MFNITNLLNQNTASSNELLFRILSDITNRMDGDFNSKNPGVRIPRNAKDAQRTCLNGKFGIFNNLPCPNVHDIGCHACMKISNIVSHHLIMGCDIEYTKTPSTE